MDDISTDNSLKILKKYKNKIKYYVNKKKTKFGSYNQINSYLKGIKKSKGKFIFFLDSDDYFKKNKVEIIVKKLENQNQIKVLFDLPLIKTEKELIKQKFVQKKFYLSSWPRFTPQSCITIDKDYMKKNNKNSKNKKISNYLVRFSNSNFLFSKFWKNIFS